MNTTENDPISAQYLILNIGDHYFAASVANIQDVIKSPKKTPVPLSKENISGVLNLRGHIVTEINVAKMLGIKDKENIQNGYAVVVTVRDEFYSLAFEGIGNVIEIKPTDIDPLPETVQKKWHQMARGVHQTPEHLIVILDPALMINMITSEDDAAKTAEASA